MPHRRIEQYKMFITFVLSEFYLPTESDTEVSDYWVEPHTLSFQGSAHRRATAVLVSDQVEQVA